jgi:autotransporter adhesin
MKKNLAKKITLSILAGAMLMSSSVAWAAKIEIEGSATGADAIAIGADSTASGDNSNAIGRSAKTGGGGTTVL